MAKKDQNEEQSVLESPEALAEQISKSEEFIEKNKNVLTYIILGIAVVIGGFFYWKSQMAEKETEAQTEMYKAQFYFDADSLTKALTGDGNNLGFMDIIEEYDGTKAANLSKFYVGVIYMQQGKFDDAITYLNEFSSSDLLIQARAYALIGDAYVETKDMANAISYYQKAADYKENEYFTPMYLMKLAQAQEANSDFAGAVTSYNKIVKNYPKAQELNDAKKRLARAEQMQ